MRRYLKKQIDNILHTMLEANEIVLKTMMTNQFVKAKAVAMDLAASAQEITISVPDEGTETKKFQECLISYVEILEAMLKAKKNSEKMSLGAVSRKRIIQAQEILWKEIISDKLRITFMPYKADMWTSMDTIWRAAKSDEECEVHVVPMPYYDITNPNDVKFHYEVERFPEEVECIHYEQYSEWVEYPDIIVIHNPYDDENNVTRVPERFYSTTLFKNTAKLVYAPYFTISSYKEEKHSWMLTAPANINADIVLAQSERVKKLYVDMGYLSEKILAFGSPKIDAVVRMEKNSREQIWNKVPEIWKSKLEGKKVFLLNTHMSYFPNCSKYKDKYGDYARKYHDEILKVLLNRDDCALIWRPHPLMKTMICGRFPEWIEYIKEIEQKINESSNGVIDNFGDYAYSFGLSDALITTYSSLINEYMVLKKPIMLFQTRLSPAVVENAPINVNVNYFRFGKEFCSFAQFRDNVVQGIDSRYDERIEEIKKAFPNLDGKAGERIYNYLKET